MHNYLRFLLTRRQPVIQFISVFFLTVLLSGTLHAQIAHFVGAQSTIGSGLNNPTGVAVDGSGNVYIADYANHRVLKETLSGGSYTESTIGSGLVPWGVAVDSSGNVYIADYANHRVLKETLSGGSYSESVIVSGLNYNQPTGVAVDSSGNVYIADVGKDHVFKETLSGGSYTESTISSGLNQPAGVAVDSSGNVYIADTYNYRVLKETLSGGSYTESTIGSGLNRPYGVAVDVSGNVYIADTYNYQVLEVPWNGSSYGTQSTIGSGLNLPIGVAVDGSGNVYIADYSNNRVLKESPSGGNFGTVNVSSTSSVISLIFTFDTGGTVGAPLVLTQGAAGLDFADAGTGSCTTNGTSHTYSAGDTCTIDVTFTPKFAWTRYGAAVLRDGSGNVIATGYVQGTGSGPQVNFLPPAESTIGSGLNRPYGVAVDGSGNVYIADTYNFRVLKETLSGSSYTESTIVSGWTSLAVVVDGSGNLYMTDTGHNQVVKVPWNGSSYGAQSTIVSGLVNSFGVAVDGSGNVYTTDNQNNRVLKVPWNGSSYGTQSTIGSGLYYPTGVAVDGSGNVYIADSGNSRVLKETLSNGSYTQSTIVSGLNQPEGVAVDGSGNVYIADTYNNRVLKVPWNGSSYGTQSTIGSGLSYPSGVTVDGSGNVYIADSGNSRVAKEDFADAPTLNFATLAVGSGPSAAQDVTMLNVGNATLSISSIGLSPANFTTQGSDTSCSLTAQTLDPAAKCVFGIEFQPTAVGSGGSLVLTDNNLYPSLPPATQTITLQGTATQGTPTLSVTNSPVTYNGSAQAATVTGSVAGTVSNVKYNGSSTVPTSAGTYAVMADFVPTDTTDYSSPSGASAGSFVINKATPTLTVTNSPVTYNGSAQAATVSSGSVAGTVSAVKYNGLATVPTSAGTYAVTADFVPTDTTDYSSLSGATAGSFVINKATPTLSVTNSPVTYNGSAQAATVSSGSVAGTVSAVKYNGSATVPTVAGTYTITADFAPTDTTDYSSLSGATAASFVINKATPTLSVTNSPVTYNGSAQAATVGSGSVAGTVSAVKYNGLATVPTSAGTYAVTADFVPTDTTDYSSLSGATAGSFVINKATPTLSVTNSPVTYNGSAQAATVSSGSVAGTVSAVKYNGSATVPTVAGTYTITADFAPTDTTDYSSLSGATAASFVINKASQATLTVTGVPSSAQAFGATFTVGSSGGSGTGAVTFSGNGACSASGTTITMTMGTGTCSVTATKAADTNYASATSTAVTVSAIESSVSSTTPVILALSPALTTAGSSAFTLTVSGANFPAGATVQWNGSARATTVVNGSQLTASITAVDVASAGTANITVVNPAPGGDTSAAFTFAIDSTTGAVTVQSTTLDVSQGQSFSFPITFGSTTAGGQITATCGNLPLNATCSYNSTTQTVTIQTSASTPPGNYQVLVIFTVTQQTAALFRQRTFMASWTGLMGLPVGLLWVGGVRRKALRPLVIGLLGLGLVLLLAGCGGSPATPSTKTMQQSVLVTLNIH